MDIIQQLVAEDATTNLALMGAVLAAAPVAINDAAIPASNGVFVVTYANVVVYCGSAVNLAKRLHVLADKTKAARGIAADQLSVRYLAMPRGGSYESVARLLTQSLKPQWAGSGFGNNALGANREGQEPSQWERTNKQARRHRIDYKELKRA